LESHLNVVIGEDDELGEYIDLEKETIKLVYDNKNT